MGNLCSDNSYAQIKELYPKQFQKYIELNEMQKQLNSSFKSTQRKLDQQIIKIQNQHLIAVDRSQGQVKEHFEKVKEQVNKHYPGGFGFLQREKNGKIEDLLGYSLAQKQYTDIKQHLEKQIVQEKQLANQKLENVKEEELNTLQSSKPVLEKFEALNEKRKSDIYTQGLNQYKKEIDAKSKEQAANFKKKVDFDSLLSNIKNLVPNDKLKSLTQQIKQQITRKAANFIGHPNQGRATLF